MKERDDDIDTSFKNLIKYSEILKVSSMNPLKSKLKILIVKSFEKSLLKSHRVFTILQNLLKSSRLFQSK